VGLTSAPLVLISRKKLSLRRGKSSWGFQKKRGKGDARVDQAWERRSQRGRSGIVGKRRGKKRGGKGYHPAFFSGLRSNPTGKGEEGRGPVPSMWKGTEGKLNRVALPECGQKDRIETRRQEGGGLKGKSAQMQERPGNHAIRAIRNAFLLQTLTRIREKKKNSKARDGRKEGAAPGATLSTERNTAAPSRAITETGEKDGSGKLTTEVHLGEEHGKRGERSTDPIGKKFTKKMTQD